MNVQPHTNPSPVELASPVELTSASQASATTPAPEAPTDPTNAPHGATWSTKGLALDTVPDPEAILTCEPLLDDDDEPESDESDVRSDAAVEHALRNVIDRLLWPALLWLIALGAVGSCVSAVLGCLVTCLRYGFPVPLAAKIVGGLCVPAVAVLYFLADRFAERMKG